MRSQCDTNAAPKQPENEGRRQKKEGKRRESPQANLAEARRLIYKHGYLRRKEELEDAEKALGS